MNGSRTTVHANQTQWNQRLPVYCAWALALVLIWLLASLFWTLFAPLDLPRPAQSVAPSSTAPTSQQRPSMANLNLFGSAAPENGYARYRNAPETVLNLGLRGIVAASSQQEGFAIIRNQAGAQGVFRVDGEIEPGVLVRAVYPDRVVLERSGTFETLRLPRDNQDGEPSPAFVQESVQGDTQESSAAPVVNPLTAAMPGIREGFTVNLADLAASYGLRPVPTGGYRISLNRNASELVELGFVNGDIILAANDVALDDEAAVAHLIQQLLAGQPLKLLISRQGEQINLSPQLDKLLQ